MSRPTRVAADLGFFSAPEAEPPAEPTVAAIDEPAPMEEAVVAAANDETPTAAPPKMEKTKPQSAESYAPTVQEIEHDEITKLAEQHWKDIPRDAPLEDTGVVEQVWKLHLDQSSFSLRKVMMLEFSQYLEKYLWPSFVPKTAKGKKKSSPAHVMSIVVMVNEKFRQRVTGVWDVFGNDTTRFSGLVTRILKLLVADDSEEGLSLQLRRFVLIFLIEMFQSLENPAVRNECMRLVSIATWSTILDKRREREFIRQPERKALWERAQAKFEGAAKASATEKMDFDRTFFSNLIKSFFRVLKSIPEKGEAPPDAIPYCERFLELMIDLEAQLPTRRHFHVMLQDHLVVPICNVSPLFKRGQAFLSQHRDISSSIPVDWGARGTESGALFVQLLERLKYYERFEIDDFTGASLSATETARRHYEQLRGLQKVAFIHARDELEDFALANVGNVEQRKDLHAALCKVGLETLHSLCDLCGHRTRDLDDGVKFEKEFLIEMLVSIYEKLPSQLDSINSMPLYPDEDLLFDETTVPATQQFSNTHCLAIPKLNLQFLTIHDYLLRNFTLFRLESTYEIRQDIEDVVRRLAPGYDVDRRGGRPQTKFNGWARMGALIDSFQIVDVGPPKLGETKPGFVKADVSFNVSKFTESIRREWESIRPHDVLFLLTIKLENTNELAVSEETTEGSAFRRKFGLKSVRGCEVIHVLGDDGRPVEDLASAKYPTEGHDRPRIAGFRRSFRVALDPNQYQLDIARAEHKEANVYATFNVLVRRKPQENNFKAVLDTIRDLMQTDLVVPTWLHNVFLGYGDRGSAHYTKIINPVRSIDFRDTFLDWNHLRESFPHKRVITSACDAEAEPSPPYVLTFPRSWYDAPDTDSSRSNRKPDTSISTGVKRKFAVFDELDQGDAIVVRTYKTENVGPYAEDIPKKNTVRFTPTQVEAIHAGTSLGLTLVVGPPGTGKTDVAVQIIANLYHNFPEQHTLIITHSNTALNQLFEKIAALDIDPRHILRLGHGQEELELTNAGSWGKYGRVNAFLEKRIQLLGEVDRLAQSLEIQGAHGHTCETAGYFYLYHILSRWEPYIHQVTVAASVSDEQSDATEALINGFPFETYFADAPQPLFPPNATFQETLDVAQGCWRHIKNMFDELEEIRAFELLRSSHDRSNYLLVKEARIVAMTCTHAALKRREFVDLGFKYDNVIMEEAGQILEVETFIPLLLQNSDPDTGASRLKRVVLIGDHNQLPPVVKNMAFQRYGNMEQSLFARFVRLGVPTIQLDAQGRARSSLAELFQWKYDNQLSNLPNVLQSREYQLANPGFAFDYQAVNVADFMGKGETEPRPHFLQNLGEAEYVVATYQYMRRLGYPAEKISILTTYNGQKELILDVLEKRCSWNPLFGNPHRVATVDKFQGQQNDYILLSLVRTKSVGHLRDVRRLIVAMSRARLGLYVFCRVQLFASCHELAPVFNILKERRPTDVLWLRTGETYTEVNQREVDSTGLVPGKKAKDKGKWVPESKSLGRRTMAIQGVEQMGSHVASSMKKHVEALKAAKAKAGDTADADASEISDVAADETAEAMEVDE
ncbi:hypothetical protein HDU86_006998 [Geranomyces michiganensis]|nr:hypothetical protein HDU86_006998 [Geranomyces michiganensis]